ncbi:hypothetical protein FZEAL_536 [Fusarium zealandicum]|uniref:Beta-lactamase-related domain-containing protein n=1 Tax=Fusarium zealandicum TaxID=1053134 RepID=A0A8H4XQ84_9HYPO|nr:hypothetical protein FZEAL_536 [Fusarium zealandicum]
MLSSPVKLLGGVENLTFSLGAFSIHDPDATTALQYHYTSPQIAKSAAGVSKVDADSVYRFASVSKMFTAYAGMVLLTDRQWNTPLAKIFPNLAKYEKQGLAQISQWENVTPLSFVSQLGGVAGNSPRSRQGDESVFSR